MACSISMLGACVTVVNTFPMLDLLCRAFKRRGAVKFITAHLPRHSSAISRCVLVLARTHHGKNGESWVPSGEERAWFRVTSIARRAQRLSRHYAFADCRSPLVRGEIMEKGSLTIDLPGIGAGGTGVAQTTASPGLSRALSDTVYRHPLI